jgi:hypothetical protein
MSAIETGGVTYVTILLVPILALYRAVLLSKDVFTLCGIALDSRYCLALQYCAFAPAGCNGHKRSG